MKATIMRRILTLREAHTMTPGEATFMNWSEIYMLSMHSSELGHPDLQTSSLVDITYREVSWRSPVHRPSTGVS